MGYNVTNQNQRELFTTAKYMIAEANNAWKKGTGPGGYALDARGKRIPDIDETQLTMGFLKTMTSVTVNTSVLQFPIVDTQQITNAQINSLMRLISMQDSFLVGSISVYLLEYYFADGNQGSPDFTTDSTYFTPITYASAFHDSSISPWFDKAWAIIWLGYLSVEVDKKVVIPYWDTDRHLYIPQQQATNFPVSGLTPDQWPLFQDQYDASTDGFYPMEPTLVFGGGRQNVVKLQLPANVPLVSPLTDAGYGTDFVVKCVLMCRGILAQNSTAVR